MLQSISIARCGPGALRRISVRYASANTKATSELHVPTPVASPTTPRVQSAAPAGTVLKGLGFLQNKPQPLALPDEDYPAWLWKLLEPESQGKTTPSASGDAVHLGKSVLPDKKSLRKQNREAIRASNFLRAQ